MLCVVARFLFSEEVNKCGTTYSSPTHYVGGSQVTL